MLQARFARRVNILSLADTEEVFAVKVGCVSRGEE